MKNLANCNGVEFLRQSNRIRKNVQTWLKDTQVLEIRKRKPELTQITNDMSDDAKEKAKAENSKRIKEQLDKNISDMLDACLEEHAEETLKVLAMMCFIEPEDANNVKATELLANFAELIGDKGVTDFFSSLMRLEVMNTLN